MSNTRAKGREFYLFWSVRATVQNIAQNGMRQKIMSRVHFDVYRLRVRCI